MGVSALFANTEVPIMADGSGQFTLTAGSPASASMKTKGTVGPTVQVGQFTGWYLDGVRVLGGVVQAIGRTRLARSNDTLLEIAIVGWRSLLEREVIPPLTFTGKTAKEIITDIVTNYCENNNIGLGTMVDGATAEELGTFITQPGQSAADIFDGLAEASGCVWYADADLNIRLKYVSDTEIGALVLSSENSNFSDPAIEESLDEYVNVVSCLVPWTAVAAHKESWVGDETVSQWNTVNPIDHIEKLRLNGVVQEKVGVDGVDEEQDWYYVPGTTIIKQNPVMPLLKATDTLDIEYYSVGQNVVQWPQDPRADPEVVARAVAEDGNGRHHRWVDVEGVTTVEAAEKRLQGYLKKHCPSYTGAALGTVPKKYTIVSRSYHPNMAELQPGMMVKLNITSEPSTGEEKTLMVQSVTGTVLPWTEDPQLENSYIQYSVTLTDYVVLEDEIQWLKDLWRGKNGTNAGTAGSASGGRTGTGAGPGSIVEAPVGPTGVVVAIYPLGSNEFSWVDEWTMPESVGGNALYDRQAQYYSDMAMTTPISEWIPLGSVEGKDSRKGESGPFPRPLAEEYLRVRVCGINGLALRSEWQYSNVATVPAQEGGVSVPPPVAPLSVSVVITEVGNDFILTTNWTLPADIQGNKGYTRLAQFYNDAGCTIPDGDPIDLGTLWEPTGLTASNGPHPRKTYPQWVKVTMAGVNGLNTTSATITSAAEAIAAVGSVDPGAGDWSIAVVDSTNDDQTGQVRTRVRLTVNSTPDNTDYFTLFYFKGANPPADIAKWEVFINQPALPVGPTVIDSWKIVNDNTNSTYQFLLKSGNYGSYPVITGSEPTKSLVIAPPGAPNQLLTFQVGIQLMGYAVPTAVYTFTYTHDQNDPLYWTTKIERIRCSAGAPDWPEAPLAIWEEVAAQPETHVQTVPWDLLGVEQHYKFRARAESRTHLLSAPLYSYITIPSSSGVDLSKSYVGSLGTGLAVSGTKLVRTSNADNLLPNGEWEYPLTPGANPLTPKDWVTVGAGVQMYTGGSVTGQYGLYIPNGGTGYVYHEKPIQVKPGDKYKVIVRYAHAATSGAWTGRVRLNNSSSDPFAGPYTETAWAYPANGAWITAESGVISVDGTYQYMWVIPAMDLSPADQPFYCDWVQLKHSADAAILTNVNAEFDLDGDGKFTLKDVDFTKAKAGTYTTEFTKEAGTNKLSMGTVIADKIKTGVLEVGATPQGGSRVSRFKVFGTGSNGTELLGWIGSDDASNYHGAWFKRVLIGGADPAGAKLYIDNDGEVVATGTFTSVKNGLTTTVNNSLDSFGYYSGVTVKNTNSNERGTFSTTAIGFIDASNYRRSAFTYERMDGYRTSTQIGVSITFVTPTITLYTAGGTSATIIDADTLSCNGGTVPGMVTTGDVRFQALRARTYNSGNLSTPGTYQKWLTIYDSNGNSIGIIPIF